MRCGLLVISCVHIRRELRSFVFVFDAANRIAVETPAYGNATFFFEIEQPMPVSQQVTPAPHGKDARNAALQEPVLQPRMHHALGQHRGGDEEIYRYRCRRAVCCSVA
jgi:hypothetical protein